MNWPARKVAGEHASWQSVANGNRHRSRGVRGDGDEAQEGDHPAAALLLHRRRHPRGRHLHPRREHGQGRRRRDLAAARSSRSCSRCSPPGTYAELITKYPHAGGAARYAERAFDKPYVTFLIGFLMLSSGITTSAALANAFAGDYLKALIDLPSVPVTLVFIAVLIAINLRGVRESLMANVGATVIEVTGLRHHHRRRGHRLRQGRRRTPAGSRPSPRASPRCQGAFAATITAFFSFLGFEAAANMAEEVKQPEPGLPPCPLRRHPHRRRRSTCSSPWALPLVVPTDQLAESEGPLLEVINASGLSFPPWLFACHRPRRDRQRRAALHGHGEPRDLRPGRGRPAAARSSARSPRPVARRGSRSSSSAP